MNKLLFIILFFSSFSFANDDCQKLEDKIGFSSILGKYFICGEKQFQSQKVTEIIYFIDKNEILAILPDLIQKFNFIVNQNSRSIEEVEKKSGTITNQWHRNGAAIFRNSNQTITVLAYEEIPIGLDLHDNPQDFRVIFTLYPDGF